MLENSTIIIQIIVIIAIFISIFSIISFFEGREKLRDSTKNNDSIMLTLFALICVSFGVFYLAKFFKEANDISTAWFLGIALKLTCAQIVSHFAGKNGRNTTLWFFLGFLEYHSALLVLAFSDKLLKVKKNNNENFKGIDDEYNQKITTLNNLYADRVLTENELETKKKELEHEYLKKHKELSASQFNEKKQIENEEFISKLKEAHKTGLLTDEEFKRKLEKFTSSKSNVE